MRMESCSCNGGAAILLQEARVWLDARQLLSVEIEELDNVR
jgi:hypothetical protein